MKKTLSFALFFLAFLLLPSFSAQGVWAEELCCPSGYSDLWWNCPLHMNRELRELNCCRRTRLLLSYEVTPKIPCDSESSIAPNEDYDEHHDEDHDFELHELSSDLLQNLNPLIFLGGREELHTDGALSVAGLINRALNLIFPLAGLALFLMLVWGGFEMLTGAASKKSLDAGKQRITAALIGFLLLFASYWIVQIVEHITGVGILS